MSFRFVDVEAKVGGLLQEIGPTAVLSCDVFDTLVHRRCSKEFVKDHVASRIAAELRRRGVTARAHVAEERLRVEAQLFDEATAAGMDPEFHIAERNERWIWRLVGDELDEPSRVELVQWSEAIEIEAELAASMPNIDMRDAVRRLRSTVGRLVFASDMYLGATNVETILEANGYAGLFDAGFVSGDLKLYKATGRMFEHMAEAEGVPPAAIVHIGDTEAADHHGPSSVGVRTVWIDDPQLSARRSQDARDHAEVVADRRAIALAADRFVHEGLGPPRSFAQSYGRTLFGPIFADFVHHAAARADSDGVSALFFLSRDGFTFRRIYEAMCEAGTGWIPDIPSRYICLSRLPVLRAMLQDGMSLKALMSAKNHLVLGSRSIGNTFSSLGLDDAMVASIAKRHGVDPAGFLHDWTFHAPPFLNLLNDRELTREARRVGAAAANIVRDYLRQEGFFDFDRIGLVDIGWGATIQDQLRDCIMDEPDCPTMYGYYFGGNQSLYDRRTPDNWMEPISASVFTEDHQLTLGNASTFSFVGLMEEAARAPHGTCVGYERREENVAPVLKPDAERGAERAAEPPLTRLQFGAVEYGREYVRAAELFRIEPDEFRTLTNTALQRVVFFPEPAEIQFWQSVHHTNDVGGIFEIDEVLVAPPRPLWRRPWGWRRVSRASMWTFGSIRYLLGVPGLVLYQLGWSSSKSRKVQAPMNARRFGAPYYFSNESRRSPARQPGKLGESAIYTDAVAKADAHVAAIEEPEVPAVRLLTPLMAAGSALVLEANRLLPGRVYANFEVVNDGLPMPYLVNRAITQPMRTRAGALATRLPRTTAAAARAVGMLKGKR